MQTDDEVPAALLPLGGATSLFAIADFITLAKEDASEWKLDRSRTEKNHHRTPTLSHRPLEFLD